MKAEQFNLISHEVKKNLINRIMDIDCDGKTKVTLSNAGSKSQKQRGLQWKWYSELALSGIGRHDDKDKIHIQSKYKWAIPILLRDDEFFADLYAMYKEKYLTNPERMRFFVDSQVHTEKFNTSQMAEYLTGFQHYWLNQGVQLTNPDLYGIKLR